ncbi:MAG: hypothetical protein ACREEM_49825 [Blastocatellia bacterium]
MLASCELPHFPLNGQTLLDKAVMPGITGGAPRPIMLQRDHGKVWYRKLVLTPAK